MSAATVDPRTLAGETGMVERTRVRWLPFSPWHLLLMPMARAVEDAAVIEGFRVHRSWWVARTAVLRIDGPARTMRLRLVNGMDVPVARRTVAMLRGLGWLDQAGAMSRTTEMSSPSSAAR